MNTSGSANIGKLGRKRRKVDFGGLERRGRSCIDKSKDNEEKETMKTETEIERYNDRENQM